MSGSGRGKGERRKGNPPFASSLFPLPFLLLACARPSNPTGPTAGGSILSASISDLAPAANPGTAATLRLGGEKSRTEFEVALRRRNEGSATNLDLTSNGEVLEREAYEGDDGAFRVTLAGVDAFAPGIDLLRFPVREGAAWDWKGKLIYAGVGRPARARVALHRDGEAIRSEVRLTFATDPERPELERRMAFWFVKGHGVVRRTLGEVSSRRPVGEPWRP